MVIHQIEEQREAKGILSFLGGPATDLPLDSSASELPGPWSLTLTMLAAQQDDTANERAVPKGFCQGPKVTNRTLKITSKSLFKANTWFRIPCCTEAGALHCEAG